MFYEELAEWGCEGKPIFPFWDKKCLRFGEDWEVGFLNGILSSNVIVLLLSEKVCLNCYLLI